MKHSIPVILFFISVFFVFQLFSLEFADLSFSQFSNQQSQTMNIFNIIVGVIVISLLFLFFMKVKESKVLKIWMIFSYLVATAIPFYLIFNSMIIGFAISGLIIFLRFKFRNLVFHDIGEFLAYLGVVMLIAPLFEPVSAVILLVIFSVYDLIAVFITKHMVKMVKESSKIGILPAMLFRYHGEGSLLGGGDMIFPAILSSSFWAYGLYSTAILSALGSTIGVLFLFLVGKRKKPYPALPSITAFSLIFSIISLI